MCDIKHSANPYIESKGNRANKKNLFWCFWKWGFGACGKVKNVLKF